MTEITSDVTRVNLSQTDSNVDTYNVFKGRYFPKVDCIDHGDINEEGSLAWIINEAGGSDRQIDLSPGDYNFITDLIIPDSVNLRFDKGAIFNGSVTITISGGLEAGLHQVFDNSVTVVLKINIKREAAWFGENSGIYYPDYNAADQGVTGNNNTIKYYIDQAAGNAATIHLLHNSGAATTTYILTTNETIPDNITLKIDRGAIIDGAFTLTINGSLDCGIYQIFGSSVTIIGSYNYMSKPLIKTVADLRLNTGNINQVVSLGGYTTSGDGGGGPDRLWLTSPLGGLVDNGGSYILPGGNVGDTISAGTKYWGWDYSGEYNVLWFGADNTETIFSGIAIQNAIDYSALNNGGAVYIPGGNYKLNTALTLYSGIKLIGDTFRSTRITQWVSTVNILDFSIGTRGIIVENLWLAYPASVSNTGIAINIAEGSSQWRIENVEVFYSNGVYAHTTVGGLINKLSIHGYDDGSGTVVNTGIDIHQGTSLTLNNIYCQLLYTGLKINYNKSVTINNIAIDHTDEPIKLSRSGVVINNLHIEYPRFNVLTGGLIDFYNTSDSQTFCVINGFFVDFLSNSLGENGNIIYSIYGAEKLTLMVNGAIFTNVNIAGNARNLRINGPASIVTSGVEWPAGFTNILHADAKVITLDNLLPLSTAVSYNPPSLIAGASVTTTVTLTGVVIGKQVAVAFGVDLMDVDLTAWVSGTDTIKVKFSNNTSGTIDLTSANILIRTIL